MKKLSILICSLENRKTFLDRLLDCLRPQLTDQVEVLVKSDTGEMSIGAKRNLLLSIAQGQYVCFADDDDLVSHDYVPKIIQATERNTDCIGIEGIITTDGKNPKKFIHSLRYRTWFERRGIYYRNPNHLNPIKREIAVKEKFPEINHGEDRDYSMQILLLLKTETFISGPIYFYEYRTNKET